MSWAQSMLVIIQLIAMDNNVIKDIIQIAQFKVKTQWECYKAKDGRLQTAHDHLHLPCKISAYACTTPTGTYIWEHPQRSCKLKTIHTSMMTQEKDRYLCDQTNKIILKKGP